MKIILVIMFLWMVYLTFSLKDLSNTYVYTTTKQIEINKIIIEKLNKY